MKIHTTLDEVRIAARQHGASLSDMEDWELLATLGAVMSIGHSAAYADQTAESYRQTVVELLRVGASNTAIARELNDRADYGPRGGQWTATSVRRLRKRLGL